MGKYKKGILGPFRGIVGTVVGAIWKGIHYMRSLPDVSPDRKPTPAQLNQQLKFSTVMEFLKPLKLLLEIGYQAFTDGISPFNAACSYHLKYAVMGTAPDYLINPVKVVFSVGDLEEPQDPGVTTGGAAKVLFDWGALVDTDHGDATDKATFMVYNPTLLKYVTLRNAVARTALSFSLQLPAAWIGHDVHCYMAFVSLDGKLVSNSVYSGVLPVI
ncbi:DUF6266 family protein [Pedobacter sp.]|jgi:hypothetical protein|uniref:DUF6266 family protein n=1 Tax=Pedobacter sp. TaxID=1411316 RepID=UPI002CB8C433|nr:DUF6266 family protein [Pedobacter sp.]HWW40453.1 DUF6266 family protein [Pedobacter sp.]